jgi:DNA-binding NarL/FixJ family response regulator
MRYRDDFVYVSMIRVAIIEDHPVFRKGLMRVVEAAPGLELAGVARSVDEFDALRLGGGVTVLLDLQLEGSNLEGPDAVAHLVADAYQVLVVSASEQPTDVVQAIGAGARGYLSKQAEETEILGAIQAVAQGRTYVSATLAGYLLQAPIPITAREREILELVAGGETDQDIAEQLTISVRTVHSHLDRIRDKTGSRRRADLTRLAIEHGIIPRSPENGRAPTPRGRETPPRGRETPPRGRETPAVPADTSEPPVTLHIRAQIEPEVAVQAVSTVSVMVARERIRHASRPTDAGGQAKVVSTQRLLLEVVARANVEVVGTSRVEITIPAEGEPKLVLFDVRATNLGVGEVWVVARQQQVPLATLVVKPRIVSQALMNTLSPVIDSREVVPAATEPRPLNLLRIIEQRHGDAVVYRYDLEASNLDLLHAFASRPIQQPRDQYVRSLFRRIEEYWISSAQDVEAFHEQLRAFGGELLDELVPVELQRILWRHRDELTHILVLSTEPFIPWELVHLKDPDSRGLPDETRFLAQMGLVRWQWGSWPPESLPLRPGRTRYIIPEYPDPRYQLLATRNERRFLEEQFGAVAVPPHHREVLDILRASDTFDLLHFAGHGVATGDDIADAQLLLEGRRENSQYLIEPLRASIVAQNFRGAQDNRPIVILNACQVGRLGYQLTSIGGFATAFVEGGAGAFVGSLWSVGDTPAHIFVQALYRALKAGWPMAPAAVKARKAARRSGDASWLAYTVYAHPHARLSPSTQTTKA